jgi:putative methyltransferase (TIGR04325 family)
MHETTYRSMHPIKRLIRAVLPPVIPIAVDRLRHALVRSPEGGIRIDLRPDWEYVREGWERSRGRTAGWRDPSIADTQRRRWAELAPVLRGTDPLDAHFFGGKAGEGDESAHNVHLTFAYVLARAAGSRSPISVLDWGGGIGYHALLAERLLPDVKVDYVVKELPELAAIGRDLMPAVRFVTDPDSCFRRTYDLVFASSSIQYEEDWQGLVSKLAGAAQGWLFLARVPCVRGAPGFVVVQRPRRWGYRTEYRSWVLNRGEVLAQAECLGLHLEREFLAGPRSRFAKAPEDVEILSFLFRARPSVPQPGTADDKSEIVAVADTPTTARASGVSGASGAGRAAGDQVRNEAAASPHGSDLGGSLP